MVNRLVYLKTKKKTFSKFNERTHNNYFIDPDYWSSHSSW